MALYYKIHKGVEEKIIDNYIKSNDEMNWIANLSEETKTDSSGAEKIVKKLSKKGVLKEVKCDIELIKRKRSGKGGSYPRICYALDYDMKPEWFIEIARFYLDTDDLSTRLNFTKSEFAKSMLTNQKIINWITEHHIGIKFNKKEKQVLSQLFILFPSTIEWILLKDIPEIVEKLSMKKTIDGKIPDVAKSTFNSFLNSLIIHDIVNDDFHAPEDIFMSVLSKIGVKCDRKEITIEGSYTIETVDS